MSKPVTNLVSYYPKPGKSAELLALVHKHYPALTKTGLCTSAPVKVWRAYDIRAKEEYFVEMFEWRDDKAAEIAHQTPEIMAVWEPMGPLLAKMQIRKSNPSSDEATVHRAPLSPEDRLHALEVVFGALAHPARRQILMTIHFWGGAMTAGEIAKRFGHAWPTTTRHLHVLEKAGLLAQEKKGRERHYRVVRRRFDVVEEWMSWFHRADVEVELHGPSPPPEPAPAHKKRR